MSCRSTRSRSTKITLNEPVEQTRKITDVFKVTRGRGKAQKKILSDGVIQPSKVLQETVDVQSSTSTLPPITVSESACSPPKRAKKSTEPVVVRSARKVLFNLPASNEAIDLPKQENVEENQQDEIQVKQESKPVPAEKSRSEPKAEEVEAVTISGSNAEKEKNDIVGNPLMAKAEQLGNKFASIGAQNKIRSKVRTVAELQAMLAEKAGLQKIHEQSQKNKSKQVEDHVHLLKSPVKAVPVGKAVARSKTRQTKDRSKQYQPSASNVPEYVLPTHVTPAKKEAVEEDAVEEKRHVFEYGKASRLIEEVKSNSTLPLPLQYERLLESFQSCDRVVSIYTTQGRRCVVSEIQKNVEKNTQISFTRKNLAQIVHVYPTSYDLRLEKRWNPFGGESKCGKFDLVMSANLTDDLSGYMLPDTPVKEEQPLPGVTPSKLLSPRKKAVNVVPRDPILDARPRLEGWRMTCRSHIFRHKLVEIAKHFHKKFMERIGLFMCESEYKKLKRFHPKFDLDTECEHIPEAEIPDVPHENVDRHFQMKDYLATVDNSVTLPSSVDAVLEELKSPVKKVINSATAIPLSPRQFAEKQASKPKGAMSLLERIRAKEEAKKAAESLRDPVIDRRVELLQRILHGLLRCITTYFAFKKVRSMELSALSEQINKSQSSMNRALVMEHVTLLCEIAPGMVILTEISGKKYLRLEQNDYSTLEKVVKDELARLQKDQQQKIGGLNVDNKKPAARALF